MKEISTAAQFTKTPLVIAIACAGWMGTAQAGEILDLSYTSGDGYVFVDTEEGAVEPGIKAITGALNNNDFTSDNGFSPAGVENCLMASSPAVCNSPKNSGKRIKNNLTGHGAFDTVYNGKTSGGTTEYVNYGKITNRTGARLLGYQVIVGTGTGANFTPASQSVQAGLLAMDNVLPLSDKAADWEGTTQTDGQNPLQRTWLPEGLFGTKEDGGTGYFSADNAGFFFETVGTDTLSADGMFDNPVYAQFFGDGLLTRGQQPEALFESTGLDDGIIQAWKAGDLWLDADGVVQDQAYIDSLIAQTDKYYIATIEDLTNVNVNYSMDIGDMAAGQFTVRYMPVFSPVVTAANSEYELALANSLDATQIPYLFLDQNTTVGEVATTTAAFDEFQEIMNAFDALDPSAQSRALGSIGTGYLRNYATQGLMLGRDSLETVFQHLQNDRTSSLGAPLVSTAVMGTPDSTALEQAAGQSITSTADLAMALNEGGTSSVALNERTSAYISGSASNGNLDSSDNGTGADYSAYSLSVGMDHYLREQLRAGGAFSYGHNEGNVDNHYGELDVDGYSLTGYVSYGGSTGLFTDVLLGYTWLDYDNDRNINIGSEQRTAKSSTDGGMSSFAVRSGYNFELGPVIAGPSLRYQYLDLSVDGYTENDAGVLNMQVDDMSFNSSTLGVGGQVAIPLQLESGTLRPYAEMHWVTEFQDDSSQVATSFTGGVVPFETPIDAYDSEYLTVGAGVETAFVAGGVPATLSLNYDGVVDNSDYSNNRVSLDLKVAF